MSSNINSKVRYSGIPRRMDNAAMDEIREKRLAAFDAALNELVAAGTVSSLSDWCKKAGKSSGTVYDFLSGKSRLMSDRTLTALCQAVGKPLAWIKGEQPHATTDRIEQAISLLSALPEPVQEEFVAMLRGRLMLHRGQR